MAETLEISVKDFLKGDKESLKSRWKLTAKIKKMKTEGYTIERRWNTDRQTYESVIIGLPPGMPVSSDGETNTLVQKLYKVIDKLMERNEFLEEQNRQLNAIKLPPPPSKKVEEAMVRFGD